MAHMEQRCLHFEVPKDWPVEKDEIEAIIISTAKVNLEMLDKAIKQKTLKVRRHPKNK